MAGSVSTAPDGRMLAAGYSDGRIVLMDPEELQPIRTLKSHDSRIWSTAFSPDGKTLASAAGETVTLWDPHNGDQILEFKVAGLVRSIDFSPDGRWLSYTGACELYVRDATTTKLVHTILRPSPDNHGVVFSPDSRWLATCGDDGTVQAWDVETGKRLFKQQVGPPGGHIGGLCFHPDGQHLATANGNGTVTILKLLYPDSSQAVLPSEWTFDREDISDFELYVAGHGDPSAAPAELVAVIGDSRFTQSYVPNRGELQDVDFGPDGTEIATVGDGGVNIWNSKTGEIIARLAADDGSAGFFLGGNIDWSREGRRIAAADTSQVMICDRPTELASVFEVGEQIRGVALSPDGKFVAIGQHDGQVKVFEADSGGATTKLVGHTNPITDLEWSPDGKRLAASSGTAAEDSGNVIVWDVQTGNAITTFDQHTHGAHSLSFTNDGRGMASGGRGVIHVWNTTTGKLSRTLKGHHSDEFVSSLDFHADGKRLASVGLHRLIVWDVQTAQEAGRIDGYFRKVQFSPDGVKLVFSNTANQLECVDTDSVVGEVRLPPRGIGRLFSMDVTPDGSLIALGGRSAIRLWNVNERKPHSTIPVYGLRLRFSHDGTRLASFPTDRAQIYDVSTSELVASTPKSSLRYPQDIEFFPDDGRFVTSDQTNATQIWDSATGALMQRFEASSPGFVYDLDISSDGKLIALAHHGGRIRLIDSKSGQTLQSSVTSGNAVAVTATGSLLAHVGEHPYIVAIRRIHEFELVHSLQEHKAKVRHLSFSPNGSLLAAADQSGRVILWDTSSGEQRFEWQLPGSVVALRFGPQGRHLVVGNSNGTAYVLRIAK